MELCLEYGIERDYPYCVTTLQNAFYKIIKYIENRIWKQDDYNLFVAFIYYQTHTEDDLYTYKREELLNIMTEDFIFSI
jgi:hypothetical protein